MNFKDQRGFTWIVTLIGAVVIIYLATAAYSAIERSIDANSPEALQRALEAQNLNITSAVCDPKNPNYYLGIKSVCKDFPKELLPTTTASTTVRATDLRDALRPLNLQELQEQTRKLLEGKSARPYDSQLAPVAPKTSPTAPAVSGQPTGGQPTTGGAVQPEPETAAEPPTSTEYCLSTWDGQKWTYKTVSSPPNDGLWSEGACVE